MHRPSSDYWEGLYSEFLHFAEESTAFRSAVKLGELWNHLQYSTLPQSAKERWKLNVDEGRSYIAAPESLQPELAERLDKLQRIVGTGTKFVYEEIVVIISQRVQIDLVLDLPSIRLEVDLSMLESIDDDIKSLSASSLNHSAFEAAKVSVRKNWRIPIRHRLLD